MPADLDPSAMWRVLAKLLPAAQQGKDDIQLAYKLCQVLTSSAKLPLETSLALVLTLCAGSALSTVEMLIISDRQMATWTGCVGWVSLDTFLPTTGAVADVSNAVYLTTINVQRLKTLGDL